MHAKTTQLVMLQLQDLVVDTTPILQTFALLLEYNIVSTQLQLQVFAHSVSHLEQLEH